jgi:hypothetical protein
LAAILLKHYLNFNHFSFSKTQLMRKLFAACALAALITSCQKEVSFETAGPGTGTGNTSGRLVKTVAITGTDTMTTLFTYDTQNRLSSIAIDGTSNGGMIDMYTYKKFEYDAAGRVFRAKQYIEQNGMSFDTSVTDIHYPNATTMEFDYSVATMQVMGFGTIDSTFYHFNSGKLDSVISRLTASFGGLDPVITKTRFTYDGNARVSNLKMYSNSAQQGSGPVELIADQIFTYGVAVAPQWMTNSAAQNYWIGGMPHTANNVVTKLESTSPGQPLANTTITTTYTLSGNKPTTATLTQSGGGQPNVVTKQTFYYQ